MDRLIFDNINGGFNHLAGIRFVFGKLIFTSHQSGGSDVRC